MTGEELVLGRETVRDFDFKNGTLCWSNDRLGDLAHGQLRFLYDPITDARYFFGAIGPKKPGPNNKKSNFCGFILPGNDPDGTKSVRSVARDFAISDTAWRGLVHFSEEALRERLVPFWQEWQKSRLTSQIVNRTLLTTTRSLIKEIFNLAES